LNYKSSEKSLDFFCESFLDCEEEIFVVDVNLNTGKFRIMSKLLLLFSFAFSSTLVLAQQELVTNGSFAGQDIAPWLILPGSADQIFFSGGTYCPQSEGDFYVVFGDQLEQTGVNNTTVGIYQTISIPANATSLSLTFRMSINTLEPGGFFDYCVVNILDAGGVYLENLWSMSNADGVVGIPGCSPWYEYSVIMPNTYNGQTIRLSIENSSNVIYPTIFRVDDVSVVATLPQACSYSLSSNSYTCPTAAGATYSSIANMNTQAGCGWSAYVTSGNTWLSCSSFGEGNGVVDISVLENTTGALRTGIVDIQGEVITILQPESGVSVQELNANNDLGYFPNPTQGILTVENPTSEKLAIRISNKLGQEVRYEMLGSGKNVIDLTTLPIGDYFIQLGDSKVEKLIVN
jgi:hypothetical protein